MTDLVLGFVLLAIIGSVIFFHARAKKQGQACVGCPYAKQCGKHHCSK